MKGEMKRGEMKKWKMEKKLVQIISNSQMPFTEAGHWGVGVGGEAVNVYTPTYIHYSD